MNRLLSATFITVIGLIFLGYFSLKNLPIPDNDFMKVIAHNNDKIYQLPLIFSDGAILQRNQSIPISGTCYETDVIKVTIGTMTRQTQCQNDKWSLALPPRESGGPYDINIQIFGEKNFTHIIKNIYWGEVWIVSGQSNMSMKGRVPEYNSAFPTNVFHLSPYSYCFTHWKELHNLSEFSAVANHFSKQLSDNLKVPIGIILIAEGSSTIAHWHPYNNSSYYNSTIKKIHPFPFKGIIWWQGESDALGPSYSFIKKIKPQIRSWIRQFIGWNWEGPGNLHLTKIYGYDYLLKSLIKEWRKDWGQGDFPFILVQLQKYIKEDDYWQKIRESQESALQLPETAMVVSYDITDGKLHPTDKKPVALRLADVASKFYKNKQVSTSLQPK